jgi:hypothetical protein
MAMQIDEQWIAAVKKDPSVAATIQDEKYKQFILSEIKKEG